MSQLRRFSLLSPSQFNIIIALKDLKAKKKYLHIWLYIFKQHTHIYVLYVTRKNIYVCIFLRFKIFPSDNFILYFFFFYITTFLLTWLLDRFAF